jgi:hypothetical protein
MSIEIFAEELEMFEPSHENTHVMHLVPLEVSEVPSEHLEQMEVHEHPNEEIVIELGLAGAPHGTKDPEPVLEVSEEDTKEEKTDENDAKPKKSEKWDWSKRGPTGFVAWIKERCDTVPTHSGYDTAGLERAIAYLERIDNEVSKAMRMDLDGELDGNQIEKVRATIDDGIERLQDRLDKVKSSKKKSRKKKADDELDDGLVKEAQKITGVQGVFVTVDMLTSLIARTCINGMVSGGHDIENLFAKQAKYYNLNKREQAQVIQLMDDMGYGIRRDRLHMPEDEVDYRSSDNGDYGANYSS